MIDSLFSESVNALIDDHGLKMAKFRTSSGKRLVVDVYYKPLEVLIPQKLAHELRLGLISLKAKNRRVGLLIPSKHAITKNVEVPSLDPEEIGNIVRLQAVRHTPYSREEVIVQHINLEVMLERYTKVLLVIISNETVRRRTDSIELAGLEIEAVHLTSEVLAASVTDTPPPAADGSEGTTALIHLEAEDTELVIVYAAKPYFIRSIPVGLIHLKQDRAAALQQLTDEFKKTYEAYLSEEHGRTIGRFIFSGIRGPEMDALSKALRDSFPVPGAVRRIEDMVALTPEAAEKMATYPQVGFGELLFDGSTEKPPQVDLLPDDLKVRRTFRNKGRDIFIAGVFVLIMFGLVVSTFLVKIYFRSGYLREMTANFEIKQREARELDALSEQTRQVREFTSKKRFGIRVLDELETLLPKEMYLSEIALTDDGKIQIKGTSELMSTVFSFVTEMENNPHFKTVTSDYTRSRKEGDKDVCDFGLSANWE